MFVWQAGPRAYLVASDNIEFADVDIFDITDPTNARAWSATSTSSELFPQILDNEQSNGGAVFNHDMVVKQIDGKLILTVDYWDSGYVQIDVTDPANPTYVTDTTFRPRIPAARLEPDAGGQRARERVLADNQFLLAADEDFGAFRDVVARDRAGRPPGQRRPGRGQRRGPIADLPDGTLNGPTAFVGDGCDPARSRPRRRTTATRTPTTSR